MAAMLNEKSLAQKSEGRRLGMNLNDLGLLLHLEIYSNEEVILQVETCVFTSKSASFPGK